MTLLTAAAVIFLFLKEFGGVKGWRTSHRTLSSKVSPIRSSLSMVQLLSPSNQKKDIFLYNTEKREKEVFKAMDQSEARKVSFYSCGPTVYDYAHIGNFRAFLTYDILKRWLTYCGYDVEHICNLTDVDDKIIVKMQDEGKDTQGYHYAIH